MVYYTADPFLGIRAEEFMSHLSTMMTQVNHELNNNPSVDAIATQRIRDIAKRGFFSPLVEYINQTSDSPYIQKLICCYTLFGMNKDVAEKGGVHPIKIRHRRDLMRKNFKDMGDDITDFFKAVDKSGCTMLLTAVIKCDDRHFLPTKLKPKFVEWLRENTKSVNLDISIEEMKARSDINETDLHGAEGIQIVDMPNAMPIGRDELGPRLDRDFSAQAGSGIRVEDRPDWILQALSECEELDHERTTFFRDPFGQNEKDGETYNVFDIWLKNGNRTQIAVNKRVGRATYLWKHTFLDYPEDAGGITTKDLRDDLYVQRYKCVSRDGFIAAIMKDIYADPDDMRPQIKHRVYWHDKKQAVLNSIDAYMTETGASSVPSSGIIRHGDKTPLWASLNLRTRWDTLDRALRHQKIIGLEGYSSLQDLASARGVTHDGQDAVPEP